MSFVAFPGQALGGGAVHAVAAGGLQQMEQVEAQRLLGGGIAGDGNARALPEAFQRGGLRSGKSPEAESGGARQLSRQGGHALFGIALVHVGDELLQGDLRAG